MRYHSGPLPNRTFFHPIARDLKRPIHHIINYIQINPTSLQDRRFRAVWEGDATTNELENRKLEDHAFSDRFR